MQLPHTMLIKPTIEDVRSSGRNDQKRRLADCQKGLLFDVAERGGATRRRKGGGRSLGIFEKKIAENACDHAEMFLGRSRGMD